MVKSNFTKWLLAPGLMLALLAPAPSRAASRENQAYGVGTNVFIRGLFLSAEGTFSNFVATYTNSPLRTNAILFQARSRIGLSNYPGALALLKLPAGKLEPDFVYWTARAYYEMGDYTNAIERCTHLLQIAADPPLPLRATLLQARALAKLPDWPGVIALLSNPDGVFQTATRTGQSDQDVVDGTFLLGEAYLHQQQDALAEAVIGKINPDSLTPDLKWQRQDLLCLVWLAEGRLEDALEGSTNLLASQTSQDQRIATAFLRGEIFEQTNQPDEALLAYSNNLEKGFPPAIIRQALGKTIDLMRQHYQPSNTMQWLDNFIQQRATNEPALDLARFHLGDLELNAYFAAMAPGTNNPPDAGTNLLQSAITNLDRVIQDFPDSGLRGRACLDLGWCDWERSNYPAATTNFSAAVLRLPWSEDQAAALLKLGDACFQEGDYPAAVIHYNQLLHDYATLASVTNGLFDLALYQLVQANLKLGHEEAATNAVEHILAWFPVSGYGEKSLLLLGQDSSDRKTNYPFARATFQRLLEKYPGTPLWPEIQLAIARTYEMEGDWTNVFNTYTSLEGHPDFATNALRPQVELSLALACGIAGQESNALMRMSNVVSLTNQFPGNTNAALAQNWIGNYLMNHGNYDAADYAFQELYNPRNFPNAGDLAWEARLMAGLAARNHLDFAGASNDFHFVAYDTNAPAAFQAQALFQFGYTVFQQFQNDHQTNESLLRTAMAVLSEVTTNSGPTNFMATLAFGQLGNCYLALADLNKSNTYAYTNAIQMYQSVLQDTNGSPVDVTARSEAEFGLGLIAERQNQPKEALLHYCNVLFDPDTRNADPVWVKEAGVKAAALYEERKEPRLAEKVYQRIQDVVPSLRSEMQRNIDRIEAAASAH